MIRIKQLIFAIVFWVVPTQVLACYYGSSQFYLGGNTLRQPSYGNAYYGMQAGCRSYPGNMPFGGMTGYFYNPRGTYCGAGAGGAFSAHMYGAASSPMNMGGGFGNCFAMMALPSLTAGFASYGSSAFTKEPEFYSYRPHYYDRNDSYRGRRSRSYVPSDSPYFVNDDEPEKPTRVRTTPDPDPPRRPTDDDRDIDLTPPDEPVVEPDDSCGRKFGEEGYGEPCPRDECGREWGDADYNKPCFDDACGRPFGDPKYDNACEPDRCGRKIWDPDYNEICEDKCGRLEGDEEYGNQCQDDCGRLDDEDGYGQKCDDNCGRKWDDEDHGQLCNDECGRKYNESEYNKACPDACGRKWDHPDLGQACPDSCGRQWSHEYFEQACTDECGRNWANEQFGLECKDSCGRDWDDDEFLRPCPDSCGRFTGDEDYGKECPADSCGREFGDDNYGELCPRDVCGRKMGEPKFGEQCDNDDCGRDFFDSMYGEECEPVGDEKPDACGRPKGDPSFNQPCEPAGDEKPDACGRPKDDPSFNQPCEPAGDEKPDACGRPKGNPNFNQPCEPAGDEKPDSCGRPKGDQNFNEPCEPAGDDKPDSCGRPKGDANFNNPDCNHEERIILTPIELEPELLPCVDPEDDGKGKDAKPPCIPLKDACEDLPEGDLDSELAKKCAELRKDETERIRDLIISVPDLNDRLEPFANCPEFRESPNELDLDHPGINGALRVMATLYQSCEVLGVEVYSAIRPGDIEKLREAYISGETSGHGNKRKLVDLEKYLKHHPYMKLISGTEPGPQCVDVTKAPPAFVYNAKAKLSEDEIDVFVDQTKATSYMESDSLPVTGFDCSGFIQAAMHADGLKYYPDDAKSKQLYRGGVSTSGIITIADDKDSCLNTVEFRNKGEGEFDLLRPGDILSFAGFHTLMIHSVGDDPLGIKKRAGDCENLVRQDFNFSVIQSGVGIQPGIGTAILSASGSYVSNDMIGPTNTRNNEIGNAQLAFDNLVDMARQMCVSKEGDSIKASGNFVKDGRRKRINLIRHDSDRKDSDGNFVCKDNPKKLKNEECVGDCLKEQGVKK